MGQEREATGDRGATLQVITFEQIGDESREGEITFIPFHLVSTNTWWLGFFRMKECSQASPHLKALETILRDQIQIQIFDFFDGYLWNERPFNMVQHVFNMLKTCMKL